MKFPTHRGDCCPPKITTMLTVSLCSRRGIIRMSKRLRHGRARGKKDIGSNPETLFTVETITEWVRLGFFLRTLALS
jgi:hypothetical protein